MRIAIGIKRLAAVSGRDDARRAIAVNTSPTEATRAQGEVIEGEYMREKECEIYLMPSWLLCRGVIDAAVA